MVGTVLLKNIQDTKTPQKQTKQKKRWKQIMKYRVSIVIHLFISTMPYQLNKVCELRFQDSGEVFFNTLSNTKNSCTIMLFYIFNIFNERFPPGVHRMISLNTAFLNIFMKIYENIFYEKYSSRLLLNSFQWIPLLHPCESCLHFSCKDISLLIHFT